MLSYYQPNPDATVPFPPVADLNDPDFEKSCSDSSDPNCAVGWGVRVLDSSDVLIYGAGLYSFFDNWDTSVYRLIFLSPIISLSELVQLLLTLHS